MKKKLGIFFLIIFFSLFLNIEVTNAAWCICGSETTYADSLSDCPDCPTDTVDIANPLGGNVTPNKLIGRLIKAMLGIVGSLALVMFIYGGFTWMLAAGNADAVAKGKSILIWATLGLVVIFSSYALIQFVFTSLGV